MQRRTKIGKENGKGGSWSIMLMVVIRKYPESKKVLYRMP